MTLMEYRGYHGTVVPDLEEGDLHGEVLYIMDTLSYRGETIPEMEKAFRETVDHYLAFCAERGMEPNKPFTGTVTLRIDKDLHREAQAAADAAGVSLNKWIGAMVEKATHKPNDVFDAAEAIKRLPDVIERVKGKPKTLKKASRKKVTVQRP